MKNQSYPNLYDDRDMEFMDNIVKSLLNGISSRTGFTVHPGDFQMLARECYNFAKTVVKERERVSNENQ